MPEAITARSIRSLCGRGWDLRDMVHAALRLPPEAGRLTIAPDGDPAGRAAAQALAERAHATGWAVSLLPAPEGRDWNDILNLKGARA